MSTKLTMTLAAALVSAASSIATMPALAGDQNLVTELQDSGRYFGVDYTTNPQHLSAHASARFGRDRTPQLHSTVPDAESDFQLQGR
jgi:hypothetical protein